jgi:hypothetical protein
VVTAECVAGGCTDLLLTASLSDAIGSPFSAVTPAKAGARYPRASRLIISALRYWARWSIVNLSIIVLTERKVLMNVCAMVRPVPL